MAKIKIDRTKFDKTLESIRKKSQDAANVYLKMIQQEFAQEVHSLSNSIFNVIDDENAFDFLPNQDIIWTGALRKSQKVNLQRFKGAITWNVRNPKNNYPYAKAVYSGFNAWGRGRYIPGRKYPELGLSRKPNLRLKMKVEKSSKGLVAYIVPLLDRY